MMPLVDILSGELNREFTALKTKGDPVPYYMAYEVVERETDSQVASLGALIEHLHNHQRGVDTTVRLGDASFDNFHPPKTGMVRFTRFAPLALNDNANQIRRSLWMETDRIYRLGAQRLMQLKTDEQLLVEQDEHDPDFSAEAVEKYSKIPEALSVNADAWSQKLRAWSAEFKSHAKLLDSNLGFRIEHEAKTFVNTEGSAMQIGSNLLRLEISAFALAPDGMDLRTFGSFEISNPAHLPADGVVAAKVRDVASKAEALVSAPPAEPIVCPAILSGRASAVFFHEIFGHRIEGHRQKNIAEGQTFTKMLNQKVLPDFLSVTFDPTRTDFNGVDLIGSYEYDDEGVKARPVKVVEEGVLKTFLLSRSPVGQFTHSNGHGRRQPGLEVVSRQSNLIVESSKQLSEADLRARLVDEIKRQNKPYGLYFEEVSSGYTTTGRRGVQAFTVVPLVVYRVFPDGRPDELVRGVDIVGTPLSSFQKILATSDHSQVFNGFCGAESGSVPVSAVSPSILVGEIETQRKQNSQQRPPILPRPETE
jgi:TldD protein